MRSFEKWPGFLKEIAAPTWYHKGVTTFIYSLADPATGEVRYIGKALNPRTRLNGHLCEAKHDGKKHRRGAWLRSLINRGERPRLTIIEECSGNGAAEEQFHIALARRDGLRLVNGSDGGEGNPGHRHSPETRAAMSELHKLIQAPRRGIPRTPEVIAKMKATKATQPTPVKSPAAIVSMKEKLRQSWATGRNRDTQFSPEVRAKMSAAAKARIARDPEAHRQRIAGSIQKAIEAANKPEVRAKVAAKRIGYKHPESVKEKIAASLRGRKRSPEASAKHSRSLRATWARKRAAEDQPTLFMPIPTPR